MECLNIPNLPQIRHLGKEADDKFFREGYMRNPSTRFETGKIILMLLLLRQIPRNICSRAVMQTDNTVEFSTLPHLMSQTDFAAAGGATVQMPTAHAQTRTRTNTHPL